MDERFEISKLITLRKLTSALSDYFAKEVSQYLANVAPLLHPRHLLGDLIRGEKLPAKGSDTAFHELQRLYLSAGPASPFQTSPELKPPLDIYSATPEIFPASYAYTPEGTSKKITIRTPLKWVLGYKDLGPQRLRELIASHARGGGLELQAAILHYLVIRIIASKPVGIAPIFASLRFPLNSGTVDEFGRLPLTYISSPFTTVRPPDDVIVMNTEVAGTSTFEEVLNIEELKKNLSDPLNEQIGRIMEEYAGNLMQDSEHALS